jgi:hypothetical protein
MSAKVGRLWTKSLLDCREVISEAELPGKPQVSTSGKNVERAFSTASSFGFCGFRGHRDRIFQEAGQVS